MHSVPRYSRPDLGVRKLSKLPCYNALLPRNPLIYRITIGFTCDFFPVFPCSAGKNRGAASLLG